MSSVIVGFSDGRNEVYEHETDQYAYKVLASGVLLLLKFEDPTWTVLFEFSPAAWFEVQGTRFVGETERLEGFFGKASRARAKSGRLIVS
ncbi:hypothetical protein [Arthrobacter sp. ok362]|uniref:hypothetical protein n=1 Tax=Arthrobacter sp. ok362 TaxID=1761745 RepID=UPI000887A6ED|nr:hypothetical protein [Arthrobacter sp. ok362]SDL41436.1 hypothetical protein SAMN04487913_109107 [Arthrobacter sp. ok362]